MKTRAWRDVSGFRRDCARFVRALASVALAAAAWPALAQPGLSIADIALAEGDDGAPTAFVFRVALSEPAPAGGVRFEIAASDGTADGADYYSLSAGPVEIPEGASGHDFTVFANPDRDYEPDETFFVEASAVDGADILDARATGTILNDEVTPQVFVDDLSVIEGDAGETTARVEVRLEYPAPVELRVDYATREGTAQPEIGDGDGDYAPATGTLTFAPGQTVGSVDIAIRGDTRDEPTEYFLLELSYDIGGPGAAEARIRIVTDDDGIHNIQPASLPDGALGERYDQGFYVDGVPGARFAVTGGALPPGIEMIVSPYNGRSYLVGFPTTVGRYGFEITAFADASPDRMLARRSYAIAIGGPTLSLPPTALPTAQFGNGYDATLNPATGAQPPYRYALTGGALPPGLTLDENGRITGEARGSGTFAFTVTVSDSSPAGPYTASREYSLQAQPPVLSVEALFPLDGTEGQPYGAQFVVNGQGTEPYALAITAGRLPEGLSLTAGGEIVGIAAESGEFAFTLTVTDSTVSVPGSGSAQFLMRIAPSPLSFGPASLPDAATDVAYRQSFVVDGGEPPYLFQIVEGALPPGIDLYDDRLQGVPTEAGTYAFSIAVSDAFANSYTRRYALTVAQTPLQSAPPPLRVATAGRPYAQQLGAYGGVRPYRFALVAGALPPGMHLAAEGLITGTPTAAGSFHARVALSDSASAPSTVGIDVNIGVELPTVTIVTDRMPVAAVGAYFATSLTALGGQAPYVFELAAGSLPAGLTLSTGGLITGTPQTAGSFVLAFTARDSSTAYGPIVGRREFTLVVEPPRLSLSPGSLPSADEGEAYSSGIAVSAGVAPYRFSVTAGALPAGLTLSEDGVVAGVPGPGTGGSSGYRQHAFTVGVTDAQGRTATYPATLTVRRPALSIHPESLPRGIVGTTEYAVRFLVQNGVAPLAYALEPANGQALPRGVRFDPASGTLGGVPQEAGQFAFRLRATDVDGRSVDREYLLQVVNRVLTLSPDTLPDAVVGSAYAQTLVASGGVPPYAYALSERYGPLPPGLQLTADGRILGTPLFAGSYDFAVVVSDGSGDPPSPPEFAFTLNVAAAAAPTVAAPEATSRDLDVAAGASATVDLTAGARGGPFTAATLVALTPASAGSARIEGERGAYRLVFVAAPDYAGRAEATYTLANAGATSAPARIGFLIAPRPDPSRDPQLRRLLDAQAYGARRFADAQIANFRQRLERLHDARAPVGFDNALRASAVAPPCVQAVGAPPGRPCARPAPAQTREVRGRETPEPPFGLWAAGTLRAANHDGRNPAGGAAFETDGLSFGADYRAGDAFAFGLGVGYGRDGGALDDARGAEPAALRSDAEALTVALYASLRPHGRTFVDLLYGHQSLRFDLRRGEDGGVHGRREAGQRFASIAAGADVAHGDWRFSPYARIEAASATLAAYVETDAPGRTLAYDAVRVDTLSANAGLRLDYRRVLSWGRIAPHLRLEYQRDLDGGGLQGLRYADLAAGRGHAVDFGGFERSRLQIELGLRIETERDWSFGVDLRTSIDDNGGDRSGDRGGGRDIDRGLMLRVDKRF